MKTLSSIRFFTLALTCAAAGAYAQVTVETETTVTTDSIDIFSQARDGQKSPGLAMAASLILPGSGHHYLGHERWALVHLTAEAASIFAFFFCDHFSKKIAQDAAGYAWVHSGANGPIADVDEYYWKLVGNFMDVQEYNTTMDLNRTPEEKINDESRVWHWDDTSSRNRYNAIRSSSRSFRIISSFFLGALVLDRIVAFIEIRTMTRNRGIRRQSRSPVAFSPFVRFAPGSVDFTLSCSF